MSIVTQVSWSIDQMTSTRVYGSEFTTLQREGARMLQDSLTVSTSLINIKSEEMLVDCL